MEAKIKDLKQRYRKAKTDAEIEALDMEMEALSKIDGFGEAMIADIQETNRKAEELLLKERLKDVLPVISISYLAKTYFNKTPQWFYQRLNGNKVNDKIVSFTKDELQTLADALEDISQKIKQSATFVV